MGRYLVNKLLHEITLDDALTKRFRAAPAETVVAWESEQVEALEPEDRAAVIAKDYATLYARGAHPFVLWCWCFAVLSGPDLLLPELGRQYRAAITPFGRPDYAT